MHLQPNTLLQGGKYKIIRHIASGGFGNTYEGIHTLMGTHVAIKEFFMKEYCNRDESTSQVSVGTQSKVEFVEKLRKKFVEEAVTLYNMRHPNIVRVTDVFDENGTSYYVMDYVEGPSLKVMITRYGVLPEDIALRYIYQVADALGYVHSLNRLHLDVKPDNIMVDKDGKAILIDFGTCKHYDEQSGENTSTLMDIKTEGYAPPEQLSGFTKFTPATDIYALGATLYKMLTGITPPSSGLLSAGEVALEPIPQRVSISTQRAVSAAMQTKKSQRPQSIAEFRKILQGNVASNFYATEDENTVCEIDDENTIFSSVPPQSSVGPTPTNSNTTAEHNYGEQWQKTPEKDKAEQTKSKKNKFIAEVVFSIVWLIVLSIWIHNRDNKNSNNTQEQSKFTGLPSLVSGLSVPQNAVDLGLSVYWGTCNIGATSPYSFGNLYAWGDVTGKKRFVTFGANTPPDNICGNPQYDYATKKLGGLWRLPSADEWYELITLCQWIPDTINYVIGERVIGPNGASIFLPASGIRYNYGVSQRNVVAEYWTGYLASYQTHTSMDGTDHYIDAYSTSFMLPSYPEPTITVTLGCGASIRPVYGRRPQRHYEQSNK